MVKIEFGKKDFFWLVPLFVILIIGFGHAYNSGAEPSIMGHSDGEIQEVDPTVKASVKDGVSWNELTGIPAGFADGVDDEGLVGDGSCYWSSYIDYTSSDLERVCGTGQYMAGSKVKYMDYGAHFSIKCCNF